MPITTPAQAQALCAAITQTRAHRNPAHVTDWHEKAIMNVLRDNWKHPLEFPDLLTHLVNVAKTSTNTTPLYIFQNLPTPGHVGPRTPCADHPTRDAHNCPGCWADVKTGMRPQDMIGQHYAVPDTLDTAMTRQG